MTYPERFRCEGFLLADVMVGLAVMILFISVITIVSHQSRDTYERARVRSVLLDAYESHRSEFGGLMPGESRMNSYAGTTTVIISANAKWYGNDRIETGINISDGSVSIDLTEVRAYPYAFKDMARGTPLCSVDLISDSKVGSFGYYSSSSMPFTVNVEAISLPINPLLPLTDIEVRNNLAFVSADSSVASEPDILTIDISNHSNPTVLSSLHTGPGIAAISLAEKYIFAATPSTIGQLQVIRYDNPSTPVLALKYKLPLPMASTTPTLGSAIFFDSNKIYLGTEKWDGHELNILDVKNPESPAKLSGLEIGSKVNDIFVRFDRAYIADSDEFQLRTVDVTNPNTPSVIDAFNPSGWERQEGKTVSWFENDLGFGRTSGGFNIPADKELFVNRDWAEDIPGGVYGIVQDRRHVYAATRTPDKELSIYDRKTGTLVDSVSLPVGPKSITCDGQSLYILAGTAPVIYEIKFTPK